MPTLIWALTAAEGSKRASAPATVVSALPPEIVKNLTPGRRSGSRRNPTVALMPVLGFDAPAAPSGQNPKMFESNTFWLPHAGNVGLAKPTARQVASPFKPPATLTKVSILPHWLPYATP